MLPNKRKEIVLVTPSIPRMWLTLLSGLTGFTEREIDVLEVLLKKREELVKQGLKKQYLSQILFSTESRKEYYTQLGISEYNFTNILGQLRKKGGIVKLSDTIEDIEFRLIPESEVVFKFILDDAGTEPGETDSQE